MRVSQIILFLILTLTTFQKSQYQKREGLCSLIPETCPDDKQLNGICCLMYGRPRYYNNFCLACKDGCDSFVYKVSGEDENCGFEDL